MNSQTNSIPVLILYEINTHFVAVLPRGKDDHAAIGKWVLEELRTISKYCRAHKQTPAVNFLWTSLDQMDLDAMEVEELLYHSDNRS